MIPEEIYRELEKLRIQQAALQFGMLMNQEALEICRTLVGELCWKMGIENRDGLPIMNWMNRRTIEELEKTLQKHEDIDQFSAMEMQHLLNESKRALGAPPPELEGLDSNDS